MAGADNEFASHGQTESFHDAAMRQCLRAVEGKKFNLYIVVRKLGHNILITETDRLVLSVADTVSCFFLYLSFLHKPNELFYYMSFTISHVAQAVLMGQRTTAGVEKMGGCGENVACETERGEKEGARRERKVSW